jgi:hypothetical protein
MRRQGRDANASGLGEIAHAHCTVSNVAGVIFLFEFYACIPADEPVPRDLVSKRTQRLQDLVKHSKLRLPPMSALYSVAAK